MVESEVPGAIGRRVIDSNQFIAIGTTDEESVPWVSPAWYVPAEYREFFRDSDPEARHSRNIAARPQVAIGRGGPVFADLEGPAKLELLSARSFPSGTVALVYPKRPL